MWWTHVSLSLLLAVFGVGARQETPSRGDTLPGIEGWWPVITVLQHLAKLQDECGGHVSKLLAALPNATFWAVQMVDASGRMPAGLLSGNIFSLGDYDECLATKAAPVTGQYCLASFKIKVPPGPKPITFRPVQDALSTPPPFSSAWNVIQSGGERWRAPRDVVHMAICVPSSCRPHLVQEAALMTLVPRAESLGVKISSVEVAPELCSTAETPPLSVADITFCCLVAVLVIVVLTSTLIDLITSSGSTDGHSTSFVRRAFQCFAARKHFVGLANMEESDGDQDLNFLFGIRLASILLVILCHKAGFTTAGPNKNPNFQEQTYSQLQFMPVLHADLVVDTFFFLAGFLVTVGLLRVLSKPESPGAAATIWPLYIFRYMRLTPAYMLTVFFYATFLPRLGSGPLWRTTVGAEQQYCIENWWTNAIYLNNYINTDRMCIEQSWYMPCDMHFFLVCVPLVALINKSPRRGFWVLVALLSASILAPFIEIYVRQTDALLLFFFDFLRGTRKHTYFVSLYGKSHLRASPYLIGVVFGWIFLKYGKKKMSKPLSIAVLLIGLGACCLSVFTGVLFYDITGVVATSHIASALYGALNRTVWAFGLGLLVIAVTLGKIKSVKAVLSWKPLVPLSKLSYGAYLLHTVVLWYSAGVVREPNYSTSFLTYLRTCGDTACTFMFALPLYLIVEAPFRDLTRLILLTLGAKKIDKSKVPI